MPALSGRQTVLDVTNDQLRTSLFWRAARKGLRISSQLALRGRGDVLQKTGAIERAFDQIAIRLGKTWERAKSDH